jgi:hypothetical protein
MVVLQATKTGNLAGVIAELIGRYGRYGVAKICLGDRGWWMYVLQPKPTLIAVGYILK